MHVERGHLRGAWAPIYKFNMVAIFQRCSDLTKRLFGHSVICWICYSFRQLKPFNTIFGSLRALTHWANFCVFCEKLCHHFRDTSAHAQADFFSQQILSSRTKLHKRLRPASELDRFLSGVKNRTDFAIYKAWSKEKVFKCAHDYQIENLAEAVFV